MELKINQSLLIFSFFSLIFFLNVAESICVPRHASKQADSPDQASKLQPQSSSPRPQQVSSSPPKSESSPPPKSSSSSSSSSSSPSSSSSSPSSSSPSSSPSSSSSSSPSPSSSSPSPSSSSSSSSSSPTSSSSSFPPPPASVPASDSPDGMTTLDTHSTGKGPGFLAKTIKPFLDHQMDQMDGALTHICKQTDFSDLCLSSLAPFFDGNSDPVSMLSVAIKACTQHAQLSLDTAQKIAATPSTNPITASKLSDCQDSYSDALDNLQAANDALGVRDFGKINSMLSAVVTDASDCEDQFPGKSSPMLDFEVKLHQMASNCLAIASLAM